MKHLGDLLAGLPLPDVESALGEVPCDPALVHDLGADLPGGHLHLWGGPRGAGKTSFLLSLLHGAARVGRRTVFATYHLPASSLALRMLAMTAGVDVRAALDGDRGAIAPEEARRLARARRCLSRLPIHVLEARGMSVRSLEDRLVRMPFRAEVMALDYLQAVIRPDGQEIGGTLRELSSLASRLHVAILVALEASEEPADDVCRLADRAGWIAPAGGSGLRRAEVLQNRYGGRPAVPLRLDELSGALERLS